MMGVYGYDVETKKYWYLISCMGIEVESGKDLSRNQMDEVRRRCRYMDWYKNTEG